MPTVHLLDYVAGNVRSLANAIEKLGYSIEWVKDPKDIDSAEVCDFKRISRSPHIQQVVNKVSMSEKAEAVDV